MTKYPEVSEEDFYAFCLACGHSEWDAKTRTSCYMNVQRTFVDAMKSLDEMREEDELKREENDNG